MLVIMVQRVTWVVVSRLSRHSLLLACDQSASKRRVLDVHPTADEISTDEHVYSSKRITE